VLLIFIVASVGLINIFLKMKLLFGEKVIGTCLYLGTNRLVGFGLLICFEGKGLRKQVDMLEFLFCEWTFFLIIGNDPLLEI